MTSARVPGHGRSSDTECSRVRIPLRNCPCAPEAHGTLAESSNVMLTLTVFPGATSIGCAFGGFFAYIPSEEPDGGGVWASQAPVGSYAALTYAGTVCTFENVTVPFFDSRDLTTAG